MLKAIATSPADATGVTAAAVLTANQFVVGSDGARGVKTADAGITDPVNGAVSAPALQLTGTWFTGGTATTTKPYVLVETTGATSNAWDTGGTGIGINAASGFAGNLLDIQVNGARRFAVTNGGILTLRNVGTIVWSGRATLSSPAADSTQLGAIDGAAPTAQTLRAQSVVAGTSNTSGQNWTIVGSLSTGSGASGDIIFNVGGTGASATVQNTALTALTIKSATAATGNPNVVLGNAATATNATDGFLHIASGAGTPTGTPTLFTGRVPMYIDTTNSQLWLYMGGAWKQPKTPAGAAVVTWQ